MFKPILVDRYTGVQQMLMLDNINLIQFAITSDILSSNPNRFYLMFKPVQTVPVKFTSITAENVSKNINKINWKVENEINIAGYDIEKSVDGRSFDLMGNIASAFNNGQSGSYQFVDSMAGSDDMFYRIKSVDFDGLKSFSNIVRVSSSIATQKLYVSPNPVENKLIKLYFTDQTKGKYLLSVLDAKGQQIKSVGYLLTDANKCFKLSVKEILHSGIYFLKVDGPNNIQTVIPVVIQ